MVMLLPKSKGVFSVANIGHVRLSLSDLVSSSGLRCTLSASAALGHLRILMASVGLRGSPH